jgi:hypothetical protein
MQLLAYREYPGIEVDTLAEFTGHERLFRGTDGSFLLHMSSEGRQMTQERIIWLPVRSVIAWLNEEPHEYGSLGVRGGRAREFAEAVPDVSTATGALRIF